MSFRGAGTACEPGIYEHGPAIQKQRTVFMLGSMAPYGIAIGGGAADAPEGMPAPSVMLKQH
jgi:hypothetical protein